MPTRWLGQQPPQSAKPQKTKPQKTKPPTRAKRQPDRNPPGGWWLADCFSDLRTHNGLACDAALKHLSDRLQTDELGTRPKLPIGWRLKLIGTDGSLFVVSPGGRLSARKVLVFRKLLTPDYRAFLPDDAPAVPSSPKPEARELVDKMEWLAQALKDNSQWPNEPMRGGYAKRIFELVKKAPLAKPWTNEETVGRLIYKLRKGGPPPAPPRCAEESARKCAKVCEAPVASHFRTLKVEA